jgi:DNA polymerase
MIWLDFETASVCDLPAAGVYNYAADSTTRVLCMAWALDNGDPLLWTPDQPFPQALIDAIINGAQIRAHNAAFERLIFWYVLCPDLDIPEPRLEQFYCTAAQARANCAPGSLEDVGRFAGAGMVKDSRGKVLVRKLCRPQADGTFNTDPQLMTELGDYCLQDLRAMRAVSQALRPLSDEELADYHTNERINDRGVRVDVPLCLAAQTYAAQELADVQARVREITQGEVASVRSAKALQWVFDRVGPDAQALMWRTIIPKQGPPQRKQSFDKTVRANLLALDDVEQVPPEVAEVIQGADDVWSSSTAKFGRLAALADPEDSRVRGAFVFAGGSATGRASSYGAQVHNFPRKSAKAPDDVRADMVAGRSLAAHGARVNDVLKAMLRPAMTASPGNVLIVADWSAIEGRVHPWLANSPAGEAKLDVFRAGRDPYKVNAAATFNTHYDAVDDAQRQVGKVQELALGFLGGAGAFKTFGRIYGVHVSDADAQRMTQAWRRANPWAQQHGGALERAYTTAMRHVGREFTAGRVTYLFDGIHLWYSLPSGRVLCYPYAKLDADGVSYAKAALHPAADAKAWPRARLWAGLACENVTQATANCLLRAALRRVQDVVLHVHDEIVLDVPAAQEAAAKAALHAAMTTPPAWAQGLPLAIEVKARTRYGK